MKSLAIAFSILVLTPLAAGAEVTKEDVKKLIAAGLSEDITLTYIRQNGSVVPLSADDVVDLKRAGASDRILASLLPGSTPAPAPSSTMPPDARGVAQTTLYEPSDPYVYTDPSFDSVDWGFSYSPWYGYCYPSYGFCAPRSRCSAAGPFCTPRYSYSCLSYSHSIATCRPMTTGRPGFTTGIAGSSRGAWSSGAHVSSPVRR